MSGMAGHMVIEEAIQRFWGLIAGLVMYLVWLIRLEAKVLRIEQDNDRRDRQRSEDMSSSKESRAALQKAQAEMQGQLGHLQTELAVANEGNKHILAAVARIEQKLEARG
jgi:hypothetical protein